MNTSPSPRLLATATLRAFFALAAGAALLATLHVLVMAASIPPLYRVAFAAMYLVLGVASLWATRLPLARAQQVMLPVILVALVVIGSIALATGWGLGAPGLYFVGVMCCMTFAVARMRQGVVATSAPWVWC